MRTFVTALLFASALAHAQVPQVISFQGYLLQSSGQPLAGPVAVTFKLYAAASGGPALWSETHGAVVPANGIVNVALGSQTPLGLAFDQPYFLGITVGGDAEMTPRTPLASLPYAIRSQFADALATPLVTGSIIDATIPLDRLSNACATGQLLVRSASGWQCLPGP